MTDIRTFYENKYLGAWDVPDGQLLEMLIDRVERGTIVGIGGQTSKKPLLFFRGVAKPMVLGATNRNLLIRMFGEHLEKWGGQKVWLGKHKTKFGGQPVDGLVLRNSTGLAQTAIVKMPERKQEEKSGT